MVHCKDCRHWSQLDCYKPGDMRSCDLLSAATPRLHRLAMVRSDVPSFDADLLTFGEFGCVHGEAKS